MIDDYKQKGNMTLQIEEPMLSKPLTELLPPEKLAWSIGPMSKPQIPVVAGSGGQPPRGTAMQVGPRAPRGVRGKQAGKFQPNLPRPPQHVGEAKGGKLKLDVPERPVPKTKVPKQPPPPVKSPKGGAS